jgi:hypothetical protein
MTSWEVPLRGAGWRGASAPSRSDPWSQYQQQRVIWHTARVSASEWTAHRAAFGGYEAPLSTPQWVDASPSGIAWQQPAHVRWNGASDRASPSGHGPPASRGVDVKHGSYARYLHRLKAEGPLRRDPVPASFGSTPLATSGPPVRGGKTLLTALGTSACPCSAGPSAPSSGPLPLPWVAPVPVPPPSPCAPPLCPLSTPLRASTLPQQMTSSTWDTFCTAQADWDQQFVLPRA